MANDASEKQYRILTTVFRHCDEKPTISLYVDISSWRLQVQT